MSLIPFRKKIKKVTTPQKSISQELFRWNSNDTTAFVRGVYALQEDVKTWRHSTNMDSLYHSHISWEGQGREMIMERKTLCASGNFFFLEREVSAYLSYYLHPPSCCKNSCSFSWLFFPTSAVVKFPVKLSYILHFIYIASLYKDN